MVPETQTPDSAAQTSSASVTPGLWRDLRDAVRGTAIDYTQGSIRRAILLLAVPMMLEMAMESTFAVVDIYFVSSLGASAIATVGLTESVLTLVYAVAIGLSMGTTALVARRIGEKRPREAAVATSIGRGIGVLVQIWVLFRGAKHIRVLTSQLRVQAEVMSRLVRTSLGAIGQFIIATSSWIGLVRIVSVCGSEALAGYTLAV